MKDKSLTIGDLKFIARKREFWAACAGCALIGAVIGWLA